VPGPQPRNIYIASEDESSSDLSSPAGTPDNSVSSGLAIGEASPVSSQTSTTKSVTVESSPAPIFTLQPVTITTTTSSSTPSSVINVSCSQLPIFSPSVGSTVSPSPPVVYTPPPPPPLPPPPPPPFPKNIFLNSFPKFTIAQKSPECFIPTGIVTPPSHQQHQSSTKIRSSKKSSKAKSQPKTRTIKFHEYKGPPSAQKSCSSLSLAALAAQSDSESSYELLLKQQQLFLQWQLEWQHKVSK